MAAGLETVLEHARRGLERLTPEQAVAAWRGGALLVDIRTSEQRAERGALPGAICIDRTVLEWRLQPGGRHSIPELAGPDTQVIVVCRQGYSSSLAAASLRSIGLQRATDMIGGVEAWIEAGLPLSDDPPDVRR
ncbi:rhodanese-like domain-containing protein [Raineyella fluvialis]|uniref:Rhodanese-like domain-containing protein n=1 Tax=Raineyella fluvialis TaxID=2662261 RepID=A0A5Q2FDY2_9ACTN|nr:rhodanese-like domain-containing protein [Raineyella fluvialis]